jgi:hypothetical protein
MGVPLVIIHFSRNSHDKASILGIPIHGNPHIMWDKQMMSYSNHLRICGIQRGDVQQGLWRVVYE